MLVAIERRPARRPAAQAPRAMRRAVRVPLASVAALLLAALAGLGHPRSSAAAPSRWRWPCRVVVWLGLETDRDRGGRRRRRCVGSCSTPSAGGPGGLLTFLCGAGLRRGPRPGAGASTSAAGSASRCSAGSATLCLGLGALLLTRYVTPAESAPGCGPPAARARRVARSPGWRALVLAAGRSIDVLFPSTGSSPGSSGDRLTCRSSPRPPPARGDGAEARPPLDGRVAASVAFLVLLSRLYQLQILRGEEYKGQGRRELREGAAGPGRPRPDPRPQPPGPRRLAPELRRRAHPVLLREALRRGGRPAGHAALASPSRRSSGSASTCAPPAGLVRFRPFTVKVDISRDELDVVEANRIELSGAVDVLPTPHRSYRHGVWASHLLGYMNEVGAEELDAGSTRRSRRRARTRSPTSSATTSGGAGSRSATRSELRGVDGMQRVVVDARGQRQAGRATSSPSRSASSPPTPGNNLVLSLDWRLQEFAEKTFPATAGVVLAHGRPKTGFLLALVDRPAVDPNKMSGRITRAELAADPRRPAPARALPRHPAALPPRLAPSRWSPPSPRWRRGCFAPGGTVYCPGHYTLGGPRWRCDKDTRPRPRWTWSTRSGPAATSSSTRSATGWAPTRIAKWGALLGLGKPTGFDLHGEIPGRHARRGLARRALARRLPARHVASTSPSGRAT